jgi:hypothetical protein
MKFTKFFRKIFLWLSVTEILKLFWLSSHILLIIIKVWVWTSLVLHILLYSFLFCQFLLQ